MIVKLTGPETGPNFVVYRIFNDTVLGVVSPDNQIETCSEIMFDPYFGYILPKKVICDDLQPTSWSK